MYKKKHCSLKYWLCVSLLLHIIILVIPFSRKSFFDASKIQTVQPLRTVSVSDVAALKKKIQQNQKKFLLDQPADSKLLESQKDPSEYEARYESAKNRKFKKEQRADPKPATAQVLKDSGAEGGGPPEKNGVTLADLGVKAFEAKDFMAPTTKISSRALSADPRRLTSGNEPGSKIFQALDDDAVELGAGNYLNSHESKYYTFYSRIYSTVAPIWISEVRKSTLFYNPHLKQSSYVTVIEVVLNSDGKVVAVENRVSSGVATFDHIAVDVWYKSGSFLNPPKDLLDSQKLIKMTWTFKIKARY